MTKILNKMIDSFPIWFHFDFVLMENGCDTYLPIKYGYLRLTSEQFRKFFDEKNYIPFLLCWHFCTHCRVRVANKEIKCNVMGLGKVSIMELRTGERYFMIKIYIWRSHKYCWNCWNGNVCLGIVWFEFDIWIFFWFIFYE